MTVVSADSNTLSINQFSPAVNAFTINYQYPSGNFRDVSRVKGDYFNWNTDSCYTNEKLLYRKLVTNAYNMHGVKCIYYPVDYNTNYDKILGEDRNRTVIRNFPLMCYFDLPPQDRIYNKFGIDEVDNFHVYVSKIHFTETSRLNASGSASAGYVYPEYTPKQGDIIKAKYNRTYYEVISVHAQEAQFLQAQHTWDFIVRVFRNDNISVSASTSADMGTLPHVVNNVDILRINSTIDTLKTSVLYTSASLEVPPNDPYGGW
jgi:hypothetical protein